MTAPGQSVELAGFQYVVLRCVPRVDREEFLNVGVVVYSQAADYLCSASRIRTGAIRALAPELDLAAVAAALDAVRQLCCGDGAAGAAGRTGLGQRFGWLAAPKSTVVQPGPVHGGMTADPARQLEHLLRSLVG
ncbi:DUF3037 domain-containing protein [Jatrophihabitans lederbergiae]|uniref:DUF3037 domain-containing protein n=1 Tax=Jatrophihabitans lederbergiae TaxID=3075547 RepID=A0ABU2J6Q3_9ACTN|nr:DUF3037 domain-containing protein [Jatrophihabitans sp. DSM 44399]MDT0260670.1 DUF3037 domain-containing protein [Jatrophihabitans sp. DSM 44399]